MGTVLNFHKLKLRFKILPISLTTYNQEPKELSIYIEHEVCRTQSFILADGPKWGYTPFVQNM